MTKFIHLLFLLLLMIACQSKTHVEYKTGDILFRGKQNNNLSSAIDEVTQTGFDHHYTHMGMIEVKNGEVMVWHATPKKGVVCETLGQFSQHETNDTVVIGLYRIKDLSDKAVATAQNRANELLGQAYDYTYILESEGYYCSEFVYELFKEDQVFQLEPMTFIDPTTSEFHKGWIRHYEQLGIEIPEGLPGCNPNGMAANERLQFVAFVQCKK